jgi:hypothetical protein
VLTRGCVGKSEEGCRRTTTGVLNPINRDSQTPKESVHEFAVRSDIVLSVPEIDEAETRIDGCQEGNEKSWTGRGERRLRQGMNDER